MSKYRILTLDGGGIRGPLTAMLLERLCKQPGLEHVFERHRWPHKVTTCTMHKRSK